MPRACLLVVLVVSVVGCSALRRKKTPDVAEYSRQMEAFYAARSASASARKPKAKPEEEPKSKFERSGEILTRAEKARKMAEAAVRLEGSDDAKDVAATYRQCGATKETCVESIDGFLERSVVGGHAGLVFFLTKPIIPNKSPDWLLTYEADVKLAEEHAAKAKAEAEKKAEADKQVLAAAQAEIPRVEAKQKECEKERLKCRNACDGGDGIACVGLSMVVWADTPPNFEEALLLAGKGCDAGSPSGCKIDPHIKKDKKKYVAELDTAWSPVESAALQIAEKRFLARFASQNLSGRRNAVAVGRMQQHIQSMLSDDYCPAKVEFVSKAGQKEFERRSKDHCENRTPSAGGLNGEQVELGAECRAVHATVCPKK